ncbi:MAG TPA: hypothetical protein V6D06_01430 [Trichocoleus sp.]
MTYEIVPSDAVQAIQDSVKTEIITVDGLDYTTRPVHRPPAEPKLQALTVYTLTGLFEFVQALGNDAAGLVVHVVDPTTVRLLDRPLPGDRDRQWECHLEADCSPIIGRGFEWGKFFEIEPFIINLQSQFADQGHRSQVLRLVGNLRSENVGTYADDGVSQAVTVRQGIASVATAEVPNPVALAPWRTFSEVAQPESEFVFRLRSGQKEGSLPSAALFPSDGGAWKLEAVESIRSWLAERIELPIIA